MFYHFSQILRCFWATVVQLGSSQIDPIGAEFPKSLSFKTLIHKGLNDSDNVKDMDKVNRLRNDKQL